MVGLIYLGTIRLAYGEKIESFLKGTLTDSHCEGIFENSKQFTCQILTIKRIVKTLLQIFTKIEEKKLDKGFICAILYSRGQEDKDNNNG